MLRKCNGTKIFTEKADYIYIMVAERFVSLRSANANLCGDIKIENADMSNNNGGEKPPRRKFKGF